MSGYFQNRILLNATEPHTLHLPIVAVWRATRGTKPSFHQIDHNKVVQRRVSSVWNKPSLGLSAPLIFMHLSLLLRVPFASNLNMATFFGPGDAIYASRPMSSHPRARLHQRRPSHHLTKIERDRASIGKHTRVAYDTDADLLIIKLMLQRNTKFHTEH